MNAKIAIIGAGNMGQAIAQGLLSKKIVSQNQLVLTNSKTGSNREAVKKADVIIFAIKPQIAFSILEEIKDIVENQLLISIMAGISIESMQKILGKEVAIVRVMPNLAAQIGQSMSVWVKSKEVTDSHGTIVQIILETIGVQMELKNEKQIDMATAISGSGPAYFFYLTELIEKEAIDLGFSQREAKMLTTQTLFGSSVILQNSQYSAEALRHMVTSKGGTTEAAIKIFQEAGLQDIVEKGIRAAFKRAREIGKKDVGEDK